MIDENELVWVQVAVPPLDQFEERDGAPLTLDNARVGARIRRYGSQAGGVVTGLTGSGSNCMRVKWDMDKYDGVAEIVPGLFVFDGDGLPPPQGWLCVRQDSRAIVSKVDTKLRCFSCGDRLLPFQHDDSRSYETAKGKEIKNGDALIVAATGESVVAKSVESGHVLCSFSSSVDGKRDDNLEDSGVWYRQQDLVLPNAEDENQNTDEEIVTIEGKQLTRRELFLKCKGDEKVARQMWKEAKGGTHTIEAARRFASCAKGHPLHARCFQGALVSGQKCPAPDCSEPLCE